MCVCVCNPTQSGEFDTRAHRLPFPTALHTTVFECCPAQVLHFKHTVLDACDAKAAAEALQHQQTKTPVQEAALAEWLASQHSDSASAHNKHSDTLPASANAASTNARAPPAAAPRLSAVRCDRRVAVPTHPVADLWEDTLLQTGFDPALPSVWSVLPPLIPLHPPLPIIISLF
jgi:hypothetical protein